MALLLLIEEVFRQHFFLGYIYPIRDEEEKVKKTILRRVHYLKSFFTREVTEKITSVTQKTEKNVAPKKKHMLFFLLLLYFLPNVA